MIAPHKRPNAIEGVMDLKTVKNAYPPDREARTPVKKIVSPIQVYFTCSVAQCFKMDMSTPEHNQENCCIKDRGASLSPLDTSIRCPSRSAAHDGLISVGLNETEAASSIIYDSPP